MSFKDYVKHNEYYITYGTTGTSSTTSSGSTVTVDSGTSSTSKSGTITVTGTLTGTTVTWAPYEEYYKPVVRKVVAPAVKKSIVQKLLMTYIKRTMELIEQDMEDYVDEDTLHEVLAELDPDHDPSRPLELILADLEKKAATSS